MKIQRRSHALRKPLKQQLQRADVRTALHLLIEAGLVVPTGEMRPDSNGVPRPVYVAAKFIGLH
jgi:hypothetical protein